MKTLLLIVCVVMTTSFFGSPSGISEKESSKKIIDYEDPVPQSVMDRFKSSFVYEDGYFRGAQIDMLRPYLSDEEILSLVKSFINYPPELSVDVWEGFKPKPRGCRANSRWICLISDVDVVHQ